MTGNCQVRFGGGRREKQVKLFARRLPNCRENRLEQRLAEHRSGAGAKLVAAAIARGIDFDVVRIWPKATRADERRLKRQHNHKRFDNTRSSL
jgi:hypothetical protein